MSKCSTVSLVGLWVAMAVSVLGCNDIAPGPESFPSANLTFTISVLAANKPVAGPATVEIKIAGDHPFIKGPRGSYPLPSSSNYDSVTGAFSQAFPVTLSPDGKSSLTMGLTVPYNIWGNIDESACTTERYWGAAALQNCRANNQDHLTGNYVFNNQSLNIQEVTVRIGDTIITTDQINADWANQHVDAQFALENEIPPVPPAPLAPTLVKTVTVCSKIQNCGKLGSVKAIEQLMTPAQGPAFSLGSFTALGAVTQAIKTSQEIVLGQESENCTQFELTFLDAKGKPAGFEAESFKAADTIVSYSPKSAGTNGDMMTLDGINPLIYVRTDGNIYVYQTLDSQFVYADRASFNAMTSLNGKWLPSGKHLSLFTLQTTSLQADFKHQSIHAVFDCNNPEGTGQTAPNPEVPGVTFGNPVSSFTLCAKVQNCDNLGSTKGTERLIAAASGNTFAVVDRHLVSSESHAYDFLQNLAVIPGQEMCTNIDFTFTDSSGYYPVNFESASFDPKNFALSYTPIGIQNSSTMTIDGVHPLIYKTTAGPNYVYQTLDGQTVYVDSATLFVVKATSDASWVSTGQHVSVFYMKPTSSNFDFKSGIGHVVYDCNSPAGQ